MDSKSEGRYIYGVAMSGRVVNLGPIGIEEGYVYTIPYEDVCAIVHDCPAKPYSSGDEEVVKNWVRAHQHVIDEARKQIGNIIPAGFDTILLPENAHFPPEQAVRDWLKRDYERFKSLMEDIKNCDEYVVQVLYEPELISEQVCQQNQGIRKIREETASQSPGMAYLYRQKLEKAVKSEVEKLAGSWFKEFYGSIKRHCQDTVIERVKKTGKGRIMLMNLSCLVAEDRVFSLGEELEKLNNLKGFSVHFSGPWPPYSFVNKVVPEELK